MHEKVARANIVAFAGDIYINYLISFYYLQAQHNISLFLVFSEEFCIFRMYKSTKRIVCGRHIAHPCRGSYHVTMPSM